jgi:carbonic anhydrase
MKSLIEGIEKFQHTVFHQYESIFRHLASGQSPEVLMITCSDSRIDPSLVTQTKPGELFMIRNAGNIVPVWGSGGGEIATIEYALRVLGVRNIAVCGHTDCGAMQAVLDPDSVATLPAVREWIESAVEARRALDGVDHADTLDAVIEENVLVQIEHLKTHPAVAEGLAEGQLNIQGLVYEIESGGFRVYRPEQGAFVPLAEVDIAELYPDQPA